MCYETVEKETVGKELLEAPATDRTVLEALMLKLVRHLIVEL